jgi:hypothetical protein
MSEDRTREDALPQWEQTLVDDYCDYRWRQLMEPMCAKMEGWRAGTLTYADMDQALEECHRQVCDARTVLNQRRDRLVTLIQLIDREWFLGWIEEHSPPAEAKLVVSD